MWMMNSKAALGLSIVDEMRDTFSRDDEIDEAMRSNTAESLKGLGYGSNEFEREDEQLVDRVIALLDGSPPGLVDVGSPDPHVVMKTSFGIFSASMKRRVSTSASVIFRSSDRGSTDSDADPRSQRGRSFQAKSVVDASVETCAAETLNLMSRACMRSAFADGRVDQRKLLQLNKHGVIFQEVFDLGVEGKNNYFQAVTKNVCRWVNDKTLVVACESADHPDFVTYKDVRRVGKTSLLKFEQLLPLRGVSQTEVSYTEELRGIKDLEGGSTVERRSAVKRLKFVSNMRMFFDSSRLIDKKGREHFATIVPFVLRRESPNTPRQVPYSHHVLLLRPFPNPKCEFPPSLVLDTRR